MWSRLKVGALSRVAIGLTRPITATYTWEWQWLFKDDMLGMKTPPAILAFWHGRQLTLPWIYRRFRGLDRGKKLYTLMSHHSDGRIAKRVAGAYGLESIAGSSSRGGMPAVRQLIRTIQSGHDIGISPDGPRGPRRTVASLGVIEIARLSGAPIFPVAYSANRLWKLTRSWDRAVFPKPFAHVVGVCAEPILVPREASPDEVKAFAETLRAKLNEATDYADACVGAYVGDGENLPHSVPVVQPGG